MSRSRWGLAAVLVAAAVMLAFTPKASADDWRISGYYGNHGNGVSFSYGEGRHYRGRYGGHHGHHSRGGYHGSYGYNYSPRYNYHRSYGGAYYYPRVRPQYYGYTTYYAPAPVYYYPTAPTYYRSSGPSVYFYYSY